MNKDQSNQQTDEILFNERLRAKLNPNEKKDEKDELKEKDDDGFPVITTGRRIAVSFLDFSFISILSILFSLFFFINSEFTLADLFKNEPNKAMEPIRIFGITLLSFVIYWIYFYFIPLFTNSRTLFRYLLKVQIISLKEQNNRKILALGLFKHNFFTWFTFIFVSVLCSTFTFAFTEPNDLKDYVISVMSLKSVADHPNDLVNVFSILTKSLYSIAGIISSIIFVHLFFNKNKRSIPDLFSHMVTLYLVRENKPKNDENDADKYKKLFKSNNFDHLINEIDKI
ncbi:RDD family protein [Ureaplasma canigenitalium]|uniref:RDD family protein n=1 Tax=Ureaplasma canigenitalium TaxID=42092 RepID=UPI0004E227C0|nr:RDD family protein [Ureaplasma canigenitalium]